MRPPRLFGAPRRYHPFHIVERLVAERLVDLADAQPLHKPSANIGATVPRQIVTRAPSCLQHVRDGVYSPFDSMGGCALEDDSNGLGFGGAGLWPGQSTKGGAG